MTAQQHLIVSSNYELLYLPHDAIVYAESQGNYSNIFIPGGYNYLVSMQLGQLEDEIAHQFAQSSGQFIRIGRGLIVNRTYIIHINVRMQQLTLYDSTSRKYMLQASQEALKQLKQLISEENNNGEF